MTIILAHKIRLQPTTNDISYFNKCCGVARFVYNWALDKWNNNYKNGLKTSALKLKKEFNRIKKEQYPWVYEVTKTATERSFINVGKAFSNFFSEKSKYPKFKKKGKSKDSFYISNDKLQIDNFRVKIPKLGWVKMTESLRFSGKIMNAAVSRIADKWFISISVETNDGYKLVKNQDSVGVDLGIKKLATLSNGETVTGPKPLKKLKKKLRRLSKSLSRKKPGSKNREKATEKIARLHYRIACIRQDVLHKLTHDLTTKYNKIAVENLNIKGMVQNRRLAKAIIDMGFFEFRRQLNYKSILTCSKVIAVNRFFPSSKLCSGCKNKKQDLKLSDRVYHCDKCGLTIDRDLNAAINILNEAFPVKINNDIQLNFNF